MQLPVHPTQVDPSYFVNGVPQQFPNFPVVDVPPSIGQDAGFILGLAALMVQQNAAANPARTFFANLVSRNGWQNNEAADLATRLFQFTDFVLQTAQHGANKQALVEEIVATTVQMMTAFYVSRYQEGMAQFITPALGQQLNNSVAGYNQMIQNCQAFYEHQRNQMAARQGGYGNPGGYGGGYGGGGGYGRPGGIVPNTGGGGYGTGHMGMHNIGSHSPLSDMSRINAPRNTTAHRNVQTTTPVYTEERPMPLSGRYGNRVGHSNEPAPTTRIVELSGGPGRETEVRRAEVAAPTPAAGGVMLGGKFFKDITPGKAAPAPAPIQATPAVQEEKPDFWVTYPEDPYREICWRDGSQLRPAVVSGWEMSRTHKNPYHRAYNPKTHLLMHLKTNDGLVQEHLEPIKEETLQHMEPYVQHELNPDLRDAEVKRLASKGGKSLVDWSKMINLTPTEGKPYSTHVEREAPAEGEDVEQVDASIEFKAVSGVISAHDVRSAETVVMVRHPELQKLAKTSTIEFYCEAVSPRLTTNELTPAVEQLRSCSTFAELITNLEMVRELYPEDVAIWDEVERRLTNGVNRILNIGFSIPWTIDSFTEDALELAGVLEKQYGEDVALKYADIAMHVIDQALCTSAVDGAEALAAEPESDVKDDVEVEEEAAPTTHVLAFANRCSVTKIPYNFADLNVAFEGTALVDRDQLPELHRLISTIFARTVDHPVTFTDRFIKTADGLWLSLDMALLSEGSFLITQHTF